MTRLLLVLVAVLLSGCSLFNKSGTTKVVKPVYHHTWYKNHRWHKRIQVGRVRVRWFEKQGVRTVRMTN